MGLNKIQEMHYDLMIYMLNQLKVYGVSNQMIQLFIDTLDELLVVMEDNKEVHI